MKAPLRLAIAGGGTGGHLFPGIAVGEALLSARPGSAVLFLGTERLLDLTALKGRNFQVAAIQSRGLKGGTLWSKLLSVLQQPLGIAQAMGHLRRFRPDLVLGVGGYVTGPVLVAGKLLGRPVGIHEQNSVPGLANRMLGRIADRVFLSIPGSEAHFPNSRCVMTGNPVRREILAAAKDAPAKAGRQVLVLGGSQGARALNMVLPDVLAEVAGAVEGGLRVTHQTGRDDEAMVREAYRKHGVEAEVSAFIDDMAGCYRASCLVVCRAGATTLAELAVMGRPSVLVPYPYAADDHQQKNAEYLARHGAAVVRREAECRDAGFARFLTELLGDAKLLANMAARAQNLARPDAADHILNECCALAGR